MKIWAKEDKKDIADKVILFLISPFLSFLYSLRKIDSKSSFIFFFLFAVFFGISFSIGGKRLSGTLDSVSYRLFFEQWVNKDFDFYIAGLKRFFEFDDGNKDYYFDTIAFFVSRVSDNYHLMFMVFAVIFSYFQLKSLQFLVLNKKFNVNLVCFIIVFLFTYNQIFNINGMRFWTAAWIAVFCIFKIFIQNNKKYYLLALCTPFVHGTYWIYISLLLISLLLRKYERFSIVLFYLSFLFSSFAVDFISSYTDILPSFLSHSAISYTEKASLPTKMSFVESSFRSLVHIYINIMLILMIKDRKIIKAKNIRNFFRLLVVWMAFANFVFSVPSLGIRFFNISFPLVAYLWLNMYEDKKYRLIIYLIPLVFSLNIWVYLKNYFTVVDLSFFLSSPIYILFKYIFLY